MNNRPLLSIIIPVYNGESYIQKTIDSIIVGCSSFNSVEVIVVNDGSTDGTLSILEEYEQKCSYIKILDKKNGGVSSARNLGLKCSLGKYIYFMDADDDIECHFFDVLVPYLKHGLSDIYVFGFNIKKNEKNKKYLPYHSFFSLLDSYLRGFIRLGIWSIVVNRTMYEDGDIEFDEETFFGEDKEVLIKLIARTNKITEIYKPLYNYYCDVNSSAMHQNFNETRVTSIIALERVVVYLKSIGSSNRTLRAAVNFLLIDYNLIINRNGLCYTSLPDCLKSLDHWGTKLPPIQVSKFYLYNLLYCLKHRCAR